MTAIWRSEPNRELTASVFTAAGCLKLTGIALTVLVVVKERRWFDSLICAALFLNHHNFDTFVMYILPVKEIRHEHFVVSPALFAGSGYCGGADAVYGDIRIWTIGAA
ncbi:MAG: hypothetical protein LBJ35_05430 [Spirochaetaceae bacterium]|nr:hypothetical protein [Spirochaetaceae bacterium]